MTTSLKQKPVTQKPGVDEIPQFLAGDIILFAGEDNLYSKVGGWLMRGVQEGPSYAVPTAQFIAPQHVLKWIS